jgi:hypothetical protein
MIVNIDRVRDFTKLALNLVNVSAIVPSILRLSQLFKQMGE